MSLINEALKKAQRQRAAEQTAATTGTPGDPPMTEPTAGAPGPRPRRRNRPAPAQTVVLLCIGAILLLLTGGATAFIFLAPDSEPARHASAPSPVAPLVGTSAPLQPTPTQPAAPVQPEPALVVALPTPVPTPAPAAVAQPLPAPPVAAVAPTPPPVAPVPVSPAPVMQPTPAPVAPAASVAGASPAVGGPPAATVASPDKPNPEVHLFLEKLRVTGIRASQNDPRVLMNDRMYRLNDLVDARLQLRLTGISNLALTFTDANGHVYTHDF